MLGFVLYTDGGCRGPLQYTGSGVHGYVWDSSLTYRGVGMTSHVTTPMGYFPKQEVPEVFSAALKAKPELSTIGAAEFMKKYSLHRVTPVTFFDGMKTIGANSTNNVAEMEAFIDALRCGLEYSRTKAKLSVLTIRADSKYALMVVVDNMHNWAANNFTLSSGEPVKNIPQVLQLLELFKSYEEEGIVIVREHVRAHNGEPGNETADYLSTAALFQSHNYPNGGFSEEKYSETDTYWKSASEQRHPMLSHRFTYFDNLGVRRDAGTYYIGNQGREIELLGKRESDGAYGVVRLKEAVPVIEDIISVQVTLPTQVETLVMMDIDAVYGQNYRFLSRFGKLCVRRSNEYRNDLIAQDKTLLTREYTPALLAHRVYDNVFRLEGILDGYLAGTCDVVAADVTDTFFVSEEVKKKDEVRIEMKLRDDIPVGIPFIEVPAKFTAEEAAEPAFTEVLRLSMGIDMPDRNALRSMASKNPKVSVVTWRIGVGFHNYGVIIECDDATGIWAGMCSNLRLTGTAAEEAAKQLDRIKKAQEERAAKKAAKKTAS